MRFILLDRICALEPGASIEAEKTLPPDEELFKDHFPGFPVVPGVLLTEMMAQAAGKCLDAERGASGRAMLAQIRSASFRAWVRPGDKAEIHASIVSSRDELATAKCYIAVNGRRVASAELLFTFVPSETFASDARDELLEAFLAQQRQSSRTADAP
jgi:3-hydroxyacyl-[acyl-carrier-protein] dehydratase